MDTTPISPAISSNGMGDPFGDAAPTAADFDAPPPGMGESTNNILSASVVGAPPPPSRGAETATALYNYDGADENDLTFVKGDIIEITEKIDEGWWRELATDPRGYSRATT